jgi:hypothetical protein
MKERTKLALKCEAVLIGIGLALVALWLLCSCGTHERIVTVEKVRTAPIEELTALIGSAKARKVKSYFETQNKK